MNTRIYIVTNKATKAKRLVEATSQSQALRHVANEMIEASIPSQKELIEALRAGAEIAKAGDPPPEPMVVGHRMPAGQLGLVNG